MRIDLGGRDTQCIETVAYEHQIIKPFHGFSVRPDALGEPGTEEVVRHTPIDRLEKWEGVNQRSTAGTPVYAAVSVRALLKCQPTLLATTIEAAPADVHTVKLYRSLWSKT